ncbi:histidine phosphatase family protein [Radiobacillus sp. PE A8.2]|uniref:histidine phosphatase family protein n=1 Tax=Radiobacillus sp. PE A8.2 TaxID=3380349 RepID=UPI00388E1A52
MKRLVMIRHCNAEGQHKDSPLTKDGVTQAQQLAKYIDEHALSINRIISSPYLRAIESIKPYAEKNDITIEIDHRLQERMLSELPIDDWLEVLEESFDNLDFRLPGGESSNDAFERANEVVQEAISDTNNETIAIVTHGNLLAIMLKQFGDDVGFKDWMQLSNPDLFVIEIAGENCTVNHLWE